ncbi:MAG TPA: bifunctional glutamate N-acetyltransferase/amino-acid acetyltransferase ArgJ [Planctomycetaceae bacterium]|nr:bifunctional glutamate N-acetyltransferase/amino-acid acetyltransferase ArgJ [Planctomycetaceae bacterium]
METSVPLPAGFRAAGVACGIKSDSSKLDLALFAADRPSTAVGVFTTNLVCGAPVKVSRSRLPRSTARGVVINSGNANACTGTRGDEDARWMTAEVAKRLDCSPEDVLVCSTGVIGRFLPREKLAAGIPAAAKQLASSPDAFRDAATAMMTTDTFAKVATRTRRIGTADVRVSGVAKGAAMIAPNMATMLAVIMTDAALDQRQAETLLRHAVERSFNSISVDGHMSTSDTLLLLASNASQASPGNQGLPAIEEMVDEVAIDLAQAIIRDAEGAGHFITLDVRGTRTREDALRIARAIADSPLVKTAIAGGDPNWGRIISAAGYAGVPFREDDLSLEVNGVLLYKSGMPTDFDAKSLSLGLRANRDVLIELDLASGKEAVRFWTSDLTAEYVRLNADYTT